MGAFPHDLKEVLVKPVLKKANLDLTDTNYRPVPNLEFMGKTIEHAVTSQLTQHISENDLWDQCSLLTNLVTAQQLPL